MAKKQKKIKQKPKKYIPSHSKIRRAIKESKVLNFSQRIRKNYLVPGMLIKFRYSGYHIHDRHPIVLVLHPKYLGKMHAINLNYCNIKQISLISKLVNQQSKHIQSSKYVHIQSPYLFYHKRLKKTLKKIPTSIYRTYNYYKVRGSILIDYKFTKEQGTVKLTLQRSGARRNQKVTSIGTNNKTKSRADQLKLINSNKTLYQYRSQKNIMLHIDNVREQFKREFKKGDIKI